jgi:uncharacterized protein (DUF169 family)
VDNGTVAGELHERLGVERRPIGVAFVEERPEGVEQTSAAVPSACTFWALGDGGVFYASADQDFNCPIGAMTMGFDMPEEVQSNLMGLVQQMTRDQYLAESEPASIPGVAKPKSGIVYGPLDELPVEPDAILLWLDPSQAMLFNEAAGSATWAESMLPAIYGRPTCAAIPVAMAERRPTLSFGCIGMRTFTGVSDRMLGVVPGSEAEDFVAALQTTAGANVVMKQFYEERRALFA